MKLRRCFVALPVDEPARTALAAAQSDLRRTGAGVRWVDPAQFHLTLKFLGEISPDEAGAADAALGPALAGCRGFPITLAGLGAFPHPDRASVIWAGCRAGAAEVAAVAAQVEDALATAGFPRERRRFSPHLTLGRVREGGANPQLAAALLAGRDRPFTTVAGREVLLLQSDLTPRGPIYTALARYPLPL